MTGYIDRIENGICVILWEGGGGLEIPQEKIPFPVKEGDGLCLVGEILSPFDNDTRRRSVQALEDELFR